MFEIVAERICEMMVILLIGVAVYRLGIIDETASKRLSDLLLTVVAPLLSIPATWLRSNTAGFQPDIVI